MTEPVGNDDDARPAAPPVHEGPSEAVKSSAVDTETAADTKPAPSTARRWWQRSGPAIGGTHRKANGEDGAEGVADGKSGKKSLGREIPVLIIVALVLALLIKSFVVQPFYIPSASMQQTLKINDRVLVNKMIYHFRDVKRGEIVVFDIDGTGFANYATPLTPPSNIVSRAFRNVENLFGLGPNNKDFIKRVIAIGGDTVACCDAKGRVTVNGVGIDEPYVYRPGPDESNRRFGPVKIAHGNLWVMGDHRNDSEDSRVGGQVPQSKVIGQAFVRVWPISHWRGFGVPKGFSVLHGAAAPTVGLLIPFRRRRRRNSWRLPSLPKLPAA